MEEATRFDTIGDFRMHHRLPFSAEQIAGNHFFFTSGVIWTSLFAV